MNILEKKELKKKIAKRRELNALNASRWRRLLKDPLHSLKFYTRQTIAYLRPYKVSQKTLWGDEMEYYLPEAASVYYYGFWEAGLTNYLVDTLREGDIFLDVGAHVGFYSVLASTLVGQAGSVHSFEPTPRTFASLKNNLDKKQNATAYNVAVFDEAKTITFTDYGPKYSAFNTFKKRGDKEMRFLGNGKLVTVETISLDNFCLTKKIRPTFIKIDVEGAEHLVLRSMHTILTEIRPNLSIEVSNSDDFRENTAKSIKMLAETYEYQGFTISPEGLLSQLRPGEEYCTDNLIFIHQSKI